MAVNDLGGMSLMAIGGTLLNIQLACLAVMASAGWPDWTILSIGTLVEMACFIVWIIMTKPPLPSKEEAKWVVLGGVFFVGSFVFMIVAVRMGVPLGDFASLNSANVVFAAFIGRIFLHEPLRWVHVLAVVCTLCGAVLISQPAVIFGNSTNNSTSGLGYAVAVLSGLCDACIYISVRKVSDTSPWWINVSFTAQAGLVLIALAPFADGFPMLQLLSKPWESLGWVGLSASLGMASDITFTVASQWCPAAISATVDTATRMVVGYALQVVCFGASLNIPTVLGAALMFCSVGAMTMLQLLTDTSPTELDDSPSTPSEGAAVHTNKEGDDESDTESLASFAASEFMGTPLSERILRQRKQGASVPPQMLGVVATVTGNVSA